MPAPLGSLPGYTFATLFEPAYAVAGDFYDHYSVPGGITITLADVMGKGLGAAILAANVRSALRAASRALDQSGQSNLAAAINSVDEQLTVDLSRTDTFVTLFHAALQTTTGTVSYVDAGHGVAAILRVNGEIEALNGDDLPLGLNFGGPWTAHEAVMNSVVIASDGLLDLIGDNAVPRDAFDLLSGHDDPAELCLAVSRLAKERMPTDDVTVVAVRRS